MEGVSNSEMSTFNGSILVGGVSASWTDLIVVLLEEFLDFQITVQFPSLIHVDVFVRTTRRVVCKEVVKPLEGRSLGDASVANVATGEVVGDQDPTCFTIETKVVFNTFTVFGLGTREQEVDRETLKRDLCSHGGMLTSRLLALFGLDARRTLLEDRIMMFELGDAFDIVVGVEEVVITRMSQALMPEKTFSSSFDLVDGSAVLNVVMKGNLVMGDREVTEIAAEIGVFMFLVSVDVLDGSAFTGGFEIGIGRECKVKGVEWGSSGVVCIKDRGNKGHGISFAVT